MHVCTDLELHIYIIYMYIYAYIEKCMHRCMHLYVAACMHRYLCMHNPACIQINVFKELNSISIFLYYVCTKETELSAALEKK